MNVESIDIGEVFMHIKIISETVQEFLVCRLNSKVPLNITVLVRQVVHLINGQWQVVATYND